VREIALQPTSAVQARKEALAPKKAPNAVVAPKAQVDDLLKAFRSRAAKKVRRPKRQRGPKTKAAEVTDEEIEQEPEPEPKELKMKTGKIDREGSVGIDFNQPTQVPDFVRGQADENGRRRLYLLNYGFSTVAGKRKLIGLAELDVSRDLVDFSLVTTSDQESKPIGYYLEMSNWDATNLGVQATFDEPLQVGKGGDSVMTSLKDPSLFIAEAGGASIPADKATSAKIAPVQMAKGVSEESVTT